MCVSSTELSNTLGCRSHSLPAFHARTRRWSPPEPRAIRNYNLLPAEVYMTGGDVAKRFLMHLGITVSNGVHDLFVWLDEGERCGSRIVSVWKKHGFSDTAQTYA